MPSRARGLTTVALPTESMSMTLVSMPTPFHMGATHTSAADSHRYRSGTKPSILTPGGASSPNEPEPAMNSSVPGTSPATRGWNSLARYRAASRLGMYLSVPKKSTTLVPSLIPSSFLASSLVLVRERTRVMSAHVGTTSNLEVSKPRER